MVMVIFQEPHKFIIILMKKLGKGGINLMENHENKEKDIKTEGNQERKFIFRPWVTKNGKKIYAKTYGKKAFKIYID